VGEIAALVSAGGAGVLVIVVGYLLRSNREDRKQYEEAIDRAERRADAAEARSRSSRERTEQARQARYAAEEKLAEARAELAALRRQGAL
jgi:CHASE3 domain sensor protein